MYICVYRRAVYRYMYKAPVIDRAPTSTTRPGPERVKVREVDLNFSWITPLPCGRSSNKTNPKNIAGAGPGDAAAVYIQGLRRWLWRRQQAPDPAPEHAPHLLAEDRPKGILLLLGVTNERIIVMTSMIDPYT